MNNEYSIDIIDLLFIDLDNRIKLDPNNDLLKRIKLYLKSHESLCRDYIYTSSKFKDTASCLTNIFLNISTDLYYDINNVLL